MDTSAPLVWNDSLMTGVPDIDEQHRILVHSLTEARAKLADETSPDVLEAITQDLLAYALYHFETEEALMHETGYTAAAGADARQHLAEHRDKVHSPYTKSRRSHQIPLQTDYVG